MRNTAQIKVIICLPHEAEKHCLELGAKNFALSIMGNGKQSNEIELRFISLKHNRAKENVMILNMMFDRRDQ